MKEATDKELDDLLVRLQKENGSLYHFGVLGMRWGVRRTSKQLGIKVERTAYAIGAKINPREAKYAFRKTLNNPNSTADILSKSVSIVSKETGVLPTDKKALRAVETMGIKKHGEKVYVNLNDTDIERLKVYTNSARYSRSVNGYLAIGEPKDYAREAEKLKQTLSKNKISDVTVYRSCNLKFSVDGIAKKLDTMSEEELTETFSKLSKNFSGKSRSENRVWSTSTSPLFAIDTWRDVNPTAASTYNTYMIINCNGCNGLLADGKTSSGKSLVTTRSNQEGILAPNKITYRKMEFDKERGMFAITLDASSD